MASSSLGWTVRAASVDDGPKEELLNRGHVPVSGDIAYLHTQRAVHFIDFGKATWGKLCEFGDDQSGVFLFEKCLYILLRHNGKKGCFQIFDLQTQAWRAPLSIKGEMWASTFCHDDGRIFAIDDGRVNCLDLSWKEYRWVRLSRKENEGLIGTEGFSLAVADNKIFVFGGIKHLKHETNAICGFDLQSNEWEEVETTGPTPSPRWGHTARAHTAGRALVVYGGFSNNVFTNDLHLLLPSMEWRGLEVRHAPPVSAWHAGWIHQPAQRLYMIAGDASRLYSLDLPCLSPEKKAHDSIKQEITSRVQEQVSRELKKIRREMVEEMKRLKIEINFQKKTRSEIEMENMYLKEERLQWEKDMDDLKAVVVEWRQEALHMRDQLTALHSEVERQKEEIAKLRAVGSSASGIGNGSPIIESKHIDFKDSVRLGDGAYGKVYLARWRGLEVAVKKFRRQVLTAENMYKIQHEVNLMRQVSIHPNCATLYGTCRPAGKKGIWIVMEAATGSVRDVLSKLGSLPLHTAVRIAADAAQALAFLHCNGIAHRDMAARNVLVTKDMRGLLSDFGLSRLVSDTSASLHTHTVGNIRWMSPDELLSTEDYTSFEISSKADVWSFGVFLWEIGTGKLLRPYSNMSDAQVVAVLRAGKTLAVDCHGFHPTIRALLQRCWRTEPSSRPAMETVQRELAGLAEELRQEAAESGANPPSPPPAKKPNDAGVTKRPAPAAAAKRNASPRPGREENSMRTALRTAMDKRRTSFEDLNSATEPSQDSTSSSIWRP
ncbi:protein kinase domain containing protein [Acanthamoeba castellanii str. Neff]|uniref:Protein kinase domain containing protein n=1 Tax=Acanthamoeba castellanii (strain ATCC 30010 / Neff) TaxID=1257118 RepID=L8HHJ2_ACACF|nr:protein kinase domain containing protein [Acanthamoeba castellanii str. Neff]ELR24667.1 protein kinase domain containing protein [Acanthamoeba castellanii str. Neff]